MEQNKRCQILGQKILDIFSRELPLDPAAMDYLESSFGIVDIRHLEELLREPSNTEALEIQEFLLFPEIRQRLELEPTLQEHRYQLEDRTLIVSEIMRTNQAVTFVHDQRRLKITLTPETAASFVNRLNIHKHCDPQLKKTIQATCSQSDALRLLVRLRAAPGAIRQQGARFLQSFFLYFQDRTESFWEYFDFLHRLLQEISPEEDPRSALQAKQFSLEKALKRADQLEHDLRHHAVETLHMRRTNILALNRDQTIKELEMAEYCLNIPTSETGL